MFASFRNKIRFFCLKTFSAEKSVLLKNLCVSHTLSPDSLISKRATHTKVTLHTYTCMQSSMTKI